MGKPVEEWYRKEYNAVSKSTQNLTVFKVIEIIDGMIDDLDADMHPGEVCALTCAKDAIRKELEL